MSEQLIRKNCEFLKADEELGVIYGFAMVSYEKAGMSDSTEPVDADGYKKYYDLAEDWVPEPDITAAAYEFMKAGHRPMLDEHTGESVGEVAFCFPLTKSFTKSLGIDSPYLGLLIGAKPYNKSMIQDYKQGLKTGFSINVYGKKEFD